MNGNGANGALLSVRGVSKRFGPVEALSDVDFEVKAGEVVALVADDGEFTFDGQTVTLHRPQDATALGIATVYQDLALCDNLDVVANLFLGSEVNSGPLRWLNEIEMERRANELLK